MIRRSLQIFPLALLLNMDTFGISAPTKPKNTIIKQTKLTKKKKQGKFNLPLILCLLGFGAYCKPVTASTIVGGVIGGVLGGIIFGVTAVVGITIEHYISRILYNTIGYKFRPILAKYISNPEEQYHTSIVLTYLPISALYNIYCGLSAPSVLGAIAVDFITYYITRICYNAIGYKFRPTVAKYISNPEEQYHTSLYITQIAITTLYLICAIPILMVLYPPALTCSTCAAI
jgi:hypothetical protein